MGLEKLYNKYKSEYSKVTMKTIMEDSVDGIYQINFYISVIAFLVFGIILLIIAYQKKPEFQISLFSIGIIIMTIGYLFHIGYKKELNKQFKQKYKLSDSKNINYKYEYYYSKIKNNDNLKKDLQYLIDFASIKIDISSRGFFYNPIAILLISFTMAIAVNLLTGNIEKNINFIVSSIMLALMLLYIVFISHVGTDIIKNKDLAFQYFLKKAQYDTENRHST